MWRHRWHVLAGLSALVIAGTPAAAQRPGGMGPMGPMGGMSRGMMGMHRDSATMAEMAVIHELLRDHDRITRTVANLANGIRTVTESDDPAVARRIREHVTTMNVRVAAGDDPGLPMESAALRTIYRHGATIRTVIDTTPKGIVVEQTSADSVTVVALQQHAAEVTELVRGGMAALHQAMMKNGGMMRRGMRGDVPDR